MLNFLDTVPVNKHGKKQSDKMASAELKQVTVLSKTDWDRIEAHLNRRHLENEKARKDLEERQHLHELSMEKVKNWSNTVYVSSGISLLFRSIIR